MAAANYVNIESRGYLPLSVTTTAVSVASFISAASAASANLSYPNYAIIRPETQGIRWRDDGTASTSAISGGFPINAWEFFEFDGEIAKLQICSQTGTATVNIVLYNVS